MVKKNKRPKPVDQESPFYIEELFFSKTDPVGNIISGNSVFVRVSQYSKEELIGQPHNIIRHPDMPKIVFKVLWDYIKADKMVIAYVKNLTKQGHYYWVLASVFPVLGGYLSIRIKPSSQYFELIPKIYQALLEAEAQGEDEDEGGGMDASFELLNKTLQEKGFNDYDSFMSAVLVEELNSRQKLIDEKQGELLSKEDNELSKSEDHLNDEFQEQLRGVLDDVQTQCNNISELFKYLFDNFEYLLSMEGLLRKNMTSVLEFSESMSMLSLNAGIECHHVGEKGRTLSVIAKVIKKKSEMIGDFAKTIVDLSDIISTEAAEIGINVSIPRLQSDMIDFFAKELWRQSRSGQIQFQEFNESRGTILLLGSLFLKTFDHLEKTLQPLHSKVSDVIKLIEVINEEINEVEKSLPAGNIEAARIGIEGEKFVLTFKGIQEASETTRKRLLDFCKELNKVINTINLIRESSPDFLKWVDIINTSVNSLKEEKLEEVPAS